MGLTRYFMRQFVSEKKNISGHKSVKIKDQEKLARPVTVICKANVSNVRKINEGIGR